INLTTGSKTDSGAWAPAPLDVVEIDSVLWADGSADGTLSRISRVIPSDAGRRLQLTRIVLVMRNAMSAVDARGDILATIRSQIQLLPDQDDEQLHAAQISMRQAKDAALA